tara:strand:+ start:127 stop:624 length:498 start_codon:yes stop_codon:yes gene_type:complete
VLTDGMEIRSLTHVDLNSMWEINEQGLPGTGKVSIEEISNLLDISELALGVYQDEQLLGFVLCLLPKTNYGSLNYAWFNQRYDEFIYVDRIAVSIHNRDRGIGSLLYQEVIKYSERNNVMITAEVSLKPPNEGSMRFHHRFGFRDVGVLEHESKSVTLMTRENRV